MTPTINRHAKVKDEWYGDLVYSKLTGHVRNPEDLLEVKSLKRQALQFVLVDLEPRKLCYWE